MKQIPALLFFAFSVISTIAQKQVLTPIDLVVISEVANSNSKLVIEYLLKQTSLDLKFVNESDSSDSAKRYFYYHRKYSNGANQTLIVTSIFSFEKKSWLNGVQYELYDESAFESFKNKMTEYGMTMVSSDKTKDGRPAWIWEYSAQDIYLKTKTLLVSKEKWGYKIVM